MATDLHRSLYSAEQTRNLDHKTISEFGYPGFTLMELAASGAASSVGRRTGDQKTGLFVCGKGNNAGDALAAARWLLQNHQHKCHIHLLFGEKELSRDTKHNLLLLKHLAEAGEPIRFSSGVLPDNGLNDPFDYIIDGLLGTGSTGELRKPLPETIQGMNSMDIPIFAMDIPSGLNPDSGLAADSTVRAVATFTFGTLKTGFYLNKAKDYTGEIELIPLPFPKYLFERERARLLLPQSADAINFNRKDALHKYDKGTVHILAGSEGLTGAAIMASLSAWRQGAGAVILYSPKKLMPAYEATLPQIIKVVTGNEEDTCLMDSHFDTIAEMIKKRPGVLLAGPGLGLHPSTMRLSERLIEAIEMPVVLDADALSVFSSLKTKFKGQNENCILTPHPGEAKSYLGADFQNDHEKLLWTEKFSAEWGVSIIMKGNPTIIASSDQTPLLTGYDTSMFTRAGFGDVLAGAVATLLSVTNDSVMASSQALLSGYRSYLNHTSDIPFSPEHLL